MSIDDLVSISALVAIAAAFGLGVFRRKRLIGPSRLAEGESAANVLRILGFAVATWAFCTLLLGAAHQSILKHQDKPAGTPLSDNEIVIYGGITESVVFVVILIATATTRPDGLRQSGINLGRLPRGILGGILGIAIALPLIIFVNKWTILALDHWHISSPPHQLLEILKENPARWVQGAVFISAGLIAPLAEEFFFRGILQTLMRSLFNSSWPAILFTAAAFALVHNSWTWPQIFFLGCCLGYAYERTGNLWMSITMHAIFNLTSMVMFAGST